MGDLATGPFARTQIRSRIELVLKDEGLRSDLKVTKGQDEDSVKGEHFMSSMHHVKGSGKTAEGKLVTIPFVAKVPVPNESWRELYGTGLMFTKEMDFYNVILPAYINFQVSDGRLGRREKEDEFRDGLEWVPRCFCTVNDGANSLVLMEDLRAAGYCMVDRMVGLDLDQSLLVMRCLGKLHAFSYCMQQKDPVTFQSLIKLTPETWMVPSSKGNRESVFQECALAAAAVIRERYPTAADMLTDRLKEGIFKLMTKAVTARDRYSVINHGDVWVNNLLFRKRSEGGNLEVKFVDYQMVRYCSPAADLSYFLLTSVERTTREQRFDVLLKEYHGTLVRWLDHFGVPTLRSTLPYAELEEQMKKYSFFGIGMALIFLPLYYIARGKVSEPQDLEPPFLPLLRDEPDIFSTNCNLIKEEIAYGRWALPQLLKDLNSDSHERCLMALNSLSTLTHDPEKLYEAVELKIIDRIHELLKINKAIIREAALIALGIACNHYVGSDATIAAEAKSRWDPENLFESFQEEQTSDDEMNSPTTYVNPVDLGRLAIILSDEYPSVRCKAANVVNNISKSWHGPVGLHENNFIPVLLERAQFENIEEIKVEVLQALHGCLLHDQFKALDLGCLTLLGKLLESDDSNVRASSAECIAALAIHPLGRLRATELDLMESLMPLLFSEEIEELASAAGCICFITMTTPSKIKAAQPDLIDRLVFLASYRQSLKLQLNAVKALTNISEAPNGRSILLGNYFKQIESIPGDHDECLERALQTLLQVISWKP